MLPYNYIYLLAKLLRTPISKHRLKPRTGKRPERCHVPRALGPYLTVNVRFR